MAFSFFSIVFELLPYFNYLNDYNLKMGIFQIMRLRRGTIHIYTHIHDFNRLRVIAFESIVYSLR